MLFLVMAVKRDNQNGKSHDVYIYVFFGQIFWGRWDCPKCGPLGM